MIPGDSGEPRLRQTIEKIRAASSLEEAEEIVEQEHTDYDELCQQRWSESPMGIVTYHMAAMGEQDLRFLRDDIDRQLWNRHDERHRQTERELNRLGLVLADYLGCSSSELHSRGRKLELEQKEARERRRQQDQADARAAVERGEINDVSEYIPF